MTKEKLYSIDENLWGRAIECGVIEDPWNAPPEDVYVMTRPTATDPTEIVIGFESGVPVTIDDRRLEPEPLIGELNRVVGSYGFGRIDMVENRRVGIKSRETYECPAALALLMAHADLESVTLERDLHHEKLRLEPRWAELVYDGLWFSPLKRALDAFIIDSQRHVTGEVRLHLEPGRCWVAGRRSPVSLYDYGLATYDAADRFRHEDSEGFVRLWGLGVATWAAVQGSEEREAPGGTDDGTLDRRRMQVASRDRDALARAVRRRHGRRRDGLLGEPGLRPGSRHRRSGRLAGPRPRPASGRARHRGGGGRPPRCPRPSGERSWTGWHVPVRSRGTRTSTLPSNAG